MALEGTLQDFALLDILQLVGMQRKTGTLTLTQRDETIRVLVQDGMVVWASPRDEVFEANLGRVLIRREMIPRERWDEIRQVRARKGRHVVPVLLETQRISRQDLEQVVQRLVLETLYRALRWRDGRYKFDAQAQVDLSRGQISPVGTETILLEAVRQMDEWPLIAQKIPSLDMVVQRSSRPVYHEQVPSEGLAILQLVEGNRTVREIAELCDFGEFEAYKGIADLVTAGALKLERRRGEAPEEKTVVPVRLPRSLPGWMFAIAVGAVTVVSLMVQFSVGHDPLYLLVSRQESAKAAMKARSASVAGQELPQALDLYFLLRGEYPDNLKKLQGEDLFVREPRDPWGQPWVYERLESSYRLRSPGPDQSPGTADDLHFSPSWRPN